MDQPFETPQPQLQPEPVGSENTPLHPIPKKTNKLLMMIIIIIVLSLVGTAIAAFYFTKTRSTQEPLPTLTPMAEPSPTPDPTTDWTAYTTSSFSFKHPLSLELDDVSGIAGPTSVAANKITTFTVPNTVTQDTDAPFDGFTIYEIPELEISLNQFIENEIAALNGLPTRDPNYEIFSIEELKGGIIFITLETAQGKSVVYIKDPDKPNIVVFSVSSTSDEFNKTFSQILDTFNFIEGGIVADASPAPLLFPSPTPLPGWTKVDYDQKAKLTLYLPGDWESKLEEFTEINSTLISMKKSVWDSYPVQLNIKADWNSTGNAEFLSRDHEVAGGIKSAKVQPPTKEEKPMERYQTSYYFEAAEKVYVFHCVHNWETATMDTCESIIQNLRLNQ